MAYSVLQVRSILFFVALFLLFLYNFSVAASVECEVTGKLIMWENDSFLDKGLIKVYKDNELVAQSISDNGKYFLKIPCGKYVFVAVYIDKDGEKYVDEKKANLIGNTTLDFMVVPYLNFSELEYEISELEVNFSNFEKEDKAENNKTDENLIIIFSSGLVILSVLIFILITSKKYIKKERDEVKEVKEVKNKCEETKRDNTKENTKKITQGMENVMAALTPNEKLVVKVLLEHGGMLRRNEIARGAKISKSSLAAALTKLEEKKIVEIDRTFVVHNVKLTDWFLSL